MPTPALTTEQMKEAVDMFGRVGSQTIAANALGLPVSTYRSRLQSAAQAGFTIPKPKFRDPDGRLRATIENGTAIVFGDCHYWPGTPPTAHRALVRFCKKLKPSYVVCHGDAFDGASISRHPPMSWEEAPTVKEELDLVRDRMNEIAKACPKDTTALWLLGNHDQRFESRLAQVAPEFRGVHGIHLKDHFSGWTPGWSVHINDDTVVKHRLSGGVHATYNNALKSGMNIVTGHLHSAKVTPVTDYRGTRYGVDTGCIADVNSPAFSYTEDNPKNWISGFAVLTFRDGKLLMPELVTVVDPDTIQFRGELISV